MCSPLGQRITLCIFLSVGKNFSIYLLNPTTLVAINNVTQVVKLLFPQNLSVFNRKCWLTQVDLKTETVVLVVALPCVCCCNSELSKFQLRFYGWLHLSMSVSVCVISHL